MDARDAGEGRGGPGRGPRPGDRLPPGRRRDRREQLHQGARPRAGHDHAGPGRPRRRVLRIHVGGGPWPRQHGRQGPDPDRVGVAGSGQDRSRTVRQPPCERGERAEQLRPGARPRPGHDHAGACRAGRGVRQLHVNGVTGSQEHGREGPGAGRGGAGGRSDGRVRAACLRRPEGLVGPDGRSRDQPERGRTAGRHQLLPPLPDHEREGQPVGGRAEEAARRAVPAREVGGAGHARRGEGAGLAEGRAERDGGARRGRARAPRQARRPRRPGRRPGALGREGGVRLPRRVRRHGPVVDDARPDAGYSAMLKQPEMAAA